MSASGSSAMAELRSACWPVHQRLEKRLDIRTRFGSLGPYRAHIARMWGFCATLERNLEPALLREALPDYGSRRKLPSLTRDLIALGFEPAAVERLERCELPTLEDAAAALGSVYVFEGATLGGRTLLPLVESNMGLTAQHGASFLASYGAEVTPMWSRFGAALDAWCEDEARRASASAAAMRTFEALEVWLCGDRA